MTDEEIIELLTSRSEIALEFISRKYGGQARSIATGILGDGDEAGECVDDALLALWGAIPPAKPDSLAAYFFRIVRNVSLNRLRSDRRRKRSAGEILPIDELNGLVSDKEEINADTETVRSVVNGFLDSLSRDDALLFVRRYWYADTTDRLCGLFGYSRKKVYRKLESMKEMLRKKLIENGVIL